MKKILLSFLMIASIIFAIGSVGAFDAGNISAFQCLVQFAVSAFVEYVAIKKIAA